MEIPKYSIITRTQYRQLKRQLILMHTSQKKNPFILVDGSSYLYRAFHALPPLTNSQGQPTGAVYGVANMLRKLVAEYTPDNMVVVFDAKGKTFRHEMYKEYKATRPPMPDDLVCQIKPLHELVRAMGMPIIIEPGVEADDVIGVLAMQAQKQGLPVLISTGDKDMAQLVNDHVTLINTMNNTLMDEQGVVDKFGVRPDQIIDYLTLVGDKSDNIPGVNKVGPKTAVKWLAEYDTLDEIMLHADDFGGKVGEYLREALSTLPLSRELVTIKLDFSLPETPETLLLQPADNHTLRKLLQQFEFTTWLEQMDKAEGKTSNNTSEAVQKSEQSSYEVILSKKDFARWMLKLEQAELFAFDTETTSLDAMKAKLVGMSFAVTAGEAAYLPLAHDYPGVVEQLPMDFVLQQLQPLLEDPEVAKLGQNLKYDACVLANHDIKLGGIRHDSMLESYILDSTASRHDMDSLCKKYLKHQTIKYEDVAGKGAKQICFDQVSIEDATPYAAEDADMSLQLHEYFWSKLQQFPKQQALYSDVEIPLIPVLVSMERNGVLIDPDALFAQSHELEDRIRQIEEQAFAVAGREFNLGSPKQLQQILYDELEIKIIKKTPKGQPSTAEDVLQKLAEEHDLPRLILEYRSMSKLKSTYTDKLPQQINPQTGRIHTSYHQAVTSTGRLSSSNPNLQNIPIRSSEGRRIREAFIAPEGTVLVAADYSQIELRIMAHLSKDPSLVEAFITGKDIHAATAAEVFANGGEVSPEQRRAAKAINFGLIYGMSAFGLGKQLGIGYKEAQEYIDSYFDRYPGVKQYMDDTRALAKEQGYVETVYGRKLHLPDIYSRNGQRRAYAERTAINAPMQGTAADIIKIAMIDIHAWLQQEKRVTMIMQVHDELVFEVAEDVQQELSQVIRKKMERAASLDVPLIADVGYGKNWNEAH